jgi:glycerophosphoryl diester phosphodiesterase
MIIVGHRGARGLAPENTLASFEKAVEHHVDMLECDLRVTKDAKIVLHHDRNLRAPDGQKYAIKEYTHQDLNKLKPDLILLSDLLKAYPDSSYYLEIKPKVDTKPIIDHLTKHAPKHFKIGSKSQKILREIHKALPDVNLIVIQPWSGVIASYRARQVGAKDVAFNKIWLWTGFIKAVSKSGYNVYAYTLNDPKKAKKWQKAGLYGVITDYPDLFDQNR